jgi:hypothetical protein
MSSFRRHQILAFLGAAIVVSPAGAAAQATQRASGDLASRTQSARDTSDDSHVI